MLDPRSEEEKDFFLNAIVKFSKKREKISPEAEAVNQQISKLCVIIENKSERNILCPVYQSNIEIYILMYTFVL